MKTAIELRKENAKYFRIWFLFGALLYPLWSLYLYYHHAEFFSSLASKSLLAVISLCFLFFSSRIQFVSERLNLFKHIAALLVSTHFVWLAHKGGWSQNYLLLTGFIVLSFSVLFEDSKRFLILGGSFVLINSISLFSYQGVNGQSLFEVCYLGVLFAFTYYASKSYLNLKSKYERMYYGLNFLSSKNTSIQNSVSLSDYLYKDPLTEVFNKNYHKRFMSMAKRVSSQAMFEFTTILVDIDDFRFINDSFGAGLGDEVLKVIADRLKSIVASHGFVARLSQDQFAIILKEKQSNRSSAFISEEIVQEVAKLIQSGSVSIRVSCSVGVASFPDKNVDSVEEVFESAEKAMQSAKELGKNNYILWSDFFDEYKNLFPKEEKRRFGS